MARSLRALLVAALALSVSSGCTSAAPSPADARASEVLFSYKLAPFRLTQAVVLTMKAETPGGNGAVQLDLSGALEIAPIGSKLKLVRSVRDVRRADVTGALAPPPKAGEPPVDLAAQLRSARGAEIVDVRGEVDKAATKTLPDRAADEWYAGMAAAAVRLPVLPDAPLVLGVPVTVAKRETEEFVGVPIALEVETTYTLLALDEQTRRATITVVAKSSGAGELPGAGVGVMVMESASEGTLEFDLAAQLPVGAKFKNSQTVEFGAERGASFEHELTSTFTPG